MVTSLSVSTYMSDSNKTYKPHTQLHGFTLYHHHRTYHKPNTFRGYIPITKLLTRIYMVINSMYTIQYYVTVL
jgi:hypothetical protein